MVQVHNQGQDLLFMQKKLQNCCRPKELSPSRAVPAPKSVASMGGQQSAAKAAPGPDGQGDASSSSHGKGRPANNQVQLAVSVLGGVPGVNLGVSAIRDFENATEEVFFIPFEVHDGKREHGVEYLAATGKATACASPASLVADSKPKDCCKASPFAVDFVDFEAASLLRSSVSQQDFPCPSGSHDGSPECRLVVSVVPQGCEGVLQPLRLLRKQLARESTSWDEDEISQTEVKEAQPEPESELELHRRLAILPCWAVDRTAQAEIPEEAATAQGKAIFHCSGRRTRMGSQEGLSKCIGDCNSIRASRIIAPRIGYGSAEIRSTDRYSGAISAFQSEHQATRSLQTDAQCHIQVGQRPCGVAKSQGCEEELASQLECLSYCRCEALGSPQRKVYEGGQSSSGSHRQGAGDLGGTRALREYQGAGHCARHAGHRGPRCFGRRAHEGRDTVSDIRHGPDVDHAHQNQREARGDGSAARGSRSQKSPADRACRGGRVRRWGWIGQASCAYAFWQGWQIDCKEICLNPGSALGTSLKSVAVCQWTHVVLKEADFKSEWEAAERAIELRAEVCPVGHDTLWRSCMARPFAQVPAHDRSVQGGVRFASTAQVFVGSALEFSMSEHQVPIAKLKHWLSHESWWGMGGSTDGSTAEEPLLSTVSSPATCALCPATPISNSYVPSEDVSTAGCDEVGDDCPTDCGHWDHQAPPSWVRSMNWQDQPQFHAMPPADALPDWWQNLRSLFDSQAVTENLDEGPILYILTWFLHGQTQLQCHHPRVLRLDQFWHHWLRDLKDLWHDRLDPAAAVAIGLVRPTPPLAPARFHAGHLIIHQNTEDLAVGVFTTLFHGLRKNAFVQNAMALPNQQSVSSVISAVQFQRQCEFPGRVCVLQVHGLHLREHDPGFDLADYDSVLLHVDHPAFRPLCDDFDVISFMAAGVHDPDVLPPNIPVIDHANAVAQEDADMAGDVEDIASSDDADESESPEDRAWYPVTVFSPTQGPGEGMANWVNHNLYIQNVARIMQVPLDEVRQVYHVRWPPANFKTAQRQALILEKHDDLPIGSRHKLVLIDVEFHPHRPSVYVEFVRAVYAVPEQFTRSNLLTFLGLRPYCELVRQRCLVWRNGELVPLQALGHIQPEHGDFLRVVVPPTPTSLNCLPTRPTARMAQIGVSRRHLFQYYINHDFTDDLHEMPVLGPFVDDIRLYQTHTSLHPRVCHRDADPAELREQYVQESAGVRPDPTPWTPLALGFERELFLQWHRFARPGAGGVEDVMLVRTWYNDHEGFPICAQSRNVSLYADVEEWRRELLRAWSDLVDQSVEIEIIIVEPDPVEEADEIAAHLILLQRPLPEARSVVITVLDSAIWNGLPRRWALRSSADPTGDELIALMGYRLLCPPPVPTTECRVWCRGHEIGMDDWLATRHGMSLTITIHRAVEADDDETVMLQSGVHRPDPVDPAVPPSEPPLADLGQDSVTRVSFSGVWQLFELLDSHLFLPRFDVQSLLAGHLAHDWTISWWSFETPCLEVRIYTDGSFARRPDEGVHPAGAAVAAFVRTKDGWHFAGALSSALPDATSAYLAELTGITVAVKFVFDLLKALGSVCVSHPALGRLLRSFVLFVETYTGKSLIFQHVPGHQGEPGNEMVDTLAGAAREGHELSPFAAWIDHVLPYADVSEWLWALFDRRFFGMWSGHDLVLPASAPVPPGNFLPDDDLAPAVADSAAGDCS
eukprot:s4248_g4.t1